LPKGPALSGDKNFGSGEPLALIAGEGSLPRIVCQTALDRGVPVVVVTFTKKIAEGLEKLADVTIVGVGEPEKLIRRFKEKGCKRLVMIGKMEKKLLFANLKFDMRAVKIMGKLAKNDDSSIMKAIITELESEGFVVEKQTDWLPSIIPPAGRLGKLEPTPEMKTDFEYGIKICRQMADMEIGQTIIVKDGVVLSVEAVEGTDEAIDRGCNLGGKGAVMIKAARPAQDLRFDIPTVGMETIKRLKKNKAVGLAVEAGKVVVVDMPEVVAACDSAGISLVAL
jgi:hypothetical protein